MGLQRRLRLPGLFCLQLLLVAAVAAADPADGWEPIFNGRDLEGWKVEGFGQYKDRGVSKPVWTAGDGAIHCAGRGFGFLRYDRELDDFALRLEYRLAEDGNSGVGIRSPVYTGAVETRPSLAGYEIQLLDDAGKKPTDRSTGSLYRYVAPAASAARPAGEWNTLEIECRGPRIRVVLNGQTIQDLDQTTVEALAQKPLRGYVSLQNHGSRTDFRQIELKTFAPGAASAP